jgi:CRP/FNR family cyclic AMP-dependent transcriptional regulator
MGRRLKSNSSRSFSVQAFLDSAGIAKKIVEFRRGEVIFAQGDPCEHVLYIRKGNVKLSVLSKSGREAVVAMLGAGEFFGEGCLAGQPVRMGSATATTPSTILLVKKDRMVRLLHKERALADRFISHMLARNIRVEEDLIDLLFNSSEKRLARTLLLLARLRQARPTGARGAGHLAGDAGGDRRNDAVAREFLHEEISASGVHRLYAWTQGQ